ncbi:MAG: multicopper oxidase domain-containing protein [Dermatophilaceae bacterium]
MTSREDPALSRRDVLRGALGIAAAGTLAACTGSPADDGMPSRSFASPPPVIASPGQRVTEASLTPQPVTLDLGGPTVDTWAYGDTVPGPTIRARAGDLLRIRVDNRLPAATTVHWHGIRLHNLADGVPGLTQDPIAAGTAYTYEFTAPDPGTYFYHPHVGVQLDRGLYAPLLIDDPAEPGGYDSEWVVVLDDWVDGTGRTPDDVLAALISEGDTVDPPTGMGGMHGMGQPMGPAPFGSSDVTYPYHLVNGRVATAPQTHAAHPGQRLRLRIVNAASDTIFTVALGGHRMTLTHTDGYAVQPRETDALVVGMGERYDALVTLGDGAFPFVAAPFAKSGRAMALVRTGAGTAPAADAAVRELATVALVGSDLLPAEATLLPTRQPDAAAPLLLTGQLRPYEWAINGAAYGRNEPIPVSGGQRLRLSVRNMTMMTHPIHVHGHTFALAGSGLRKDTVLVAPMASLALDVQADNPGDWMVHCHNAYHAEGGMMIALRYGASVVSVG